MSWFRRNEQIIEVETNEDRLQIAEERYQESKRVFNAASEAVETYKNTHQTPSPFFVHGNRVMVPVNRAERSDQVLERLQNEREHARQLFCQRQRVRAEMRMRAGLTK